MEERDIRKYAQIMKDLDLTGLEITENGKVVHLERAASQISAPAPAPTASYAARQQLFAEPSADVEEVCSPMVGVFYRAPAENAAPYVQVGDKVKKGDTLCVIEAMKLMTDIAADVDGTVAEICAENRQAVDYGRVLFRIQREEARA